MAELINQSNSETKQVLPLITLRGITITPHNNVQILAARPQSIEAFKSALKNKQHEIAIFCQLSDRDENPDFTRLQHIGVKCRVLSGKNTAGDQDTFQALVFGVGRIRLHKLIDDPKLDFRQAEFTDIDEPNCDVKQLEQFTQTLQSSLSYAMDNSEHCVRPLLDNSIPSEIVSRIRREEDLSLLTDMLAQILVLDPLDKRMLLETLSPIERAKVLISELNGYSYKAEIEQKIRDEAKASMEKNQKEYYLNEQLKAIKHELNADQDAAAEIDEYRKRAKELKAPVAVKEKLTKEINKLAAMTINSAESSMERSYIDTLLAIPWQKSSRVNKDLNKAKTILNTDHYGLDKVKDRILEYLAVQARADRLHGPILCLMGPPGIGKTSLGASIAKATGRKFVRFSLGGVHDEAEIRGHRRTYIGALPGRIIHNLIKVGVNNPLFLLDEIDKMTSSIHGDPASALLEVLDPEQNKAFNDNYVELDYDLSKVMFITTANSYNIPEPLLDRMDIIDLASYTEEEKFRIGKDHLLPKQMRENTLSADEFELSDEALRELIRYYTHEAGVRGLERLISQLCRKTVKDMLLSAKDKQSAPAKRVIKVEDIKELLGPRRFDFTSRLKENRVGLVNGLAWTQLGGDILQLEAVANAGKGQHKLTGKLGEVMKESISAAMTLVRARAAFMHLDPKLFESCDLHIHVPEGATPKEGPSAGIGMVTAIVSALTGNPVRADVAMTGEITLRGAVLPIGGLKEKLLAALRGGIKTVLIPKDNEKDLWDMPECVKQGLKIIPVSSIDEVLPLALEHEPGAFIPVTQWAEKKADTGKQEAVCASAGKAC